MQNLTIKQWADDDKPREKLMLKGKDALSDAELLAILIGSGSTNESAVRLCQRITAEAKHNLNDLSKYSVEQLMRFKGIGEAKAITIIAALELGKRRQHETHKNIEKITTSREAYYTICSFLEDLPHEEFWVIYLSNANQVLAKKQISKGALNATTTDVRLILKYALENNALGMVLAHNHPSGNLEPSPEDFNVTRMIKSAAQLFRINILDHIIVGKNQYYSFADAEKL